VYEHNYEDFRNLDKKKKDVQEEELNTISQNEFENEVNKEYSNFILVVEKESL
jgi:hypothetical protein